MPDMGLYLVKFHLGLQSLSALLSSYTEVNNSLTSFRIKVIRNLMSFRTTIVKCHSLISGYLLRAHCNKGPGLLSVVLVHVGMTPY